MNRYNQMRDESKNEPNIDFMRKVNRNGYYNTELKIETHYGHIMLTLY